jgi:inosine-uridine nucleoside N-ribohydrolase
MPRRSLPLTIVLLALILVAFVVPAQAGRNTPPAPFFVDTDIGVDDALAISWLLGQRDANVVGFSTVFGNTSLENSTRNLLTLLDTAATLRPVTMGAAQPLELPRTRTGTFIHGPDGFWFVQQPHDLSAVPNDAPAAIAAAARANPGLTIVALGPLTNIAQAIQRYPADLAGVRLVALGGGKRGNSTAVAEFNIYADPHALDVVLGGPMQVELVTIDAFEQLAFDIERFPQQLGRRGGDVGELLAPAVSAYFQAGTMGMSDESAIPDAAAVVYALNSSVGTPASALVRVGTENDAFRGQTIIGDSLGTRMPLLASDEELSALSDRLLEPGFDLNAAIGAILAREPDNAKVILDIDERQVVRLFERGLFR